MKNTVGKTIFGVIVVAFLTTAAVMHSIYLAGWTLAITFLELDSLLQK